MYHYIVHDISTPQEEFLESFFRFPTSYLGDELKVFDLFSPCTFDSGLYVLRVFEISIALPLVEHACLFEKCSFLFAAQVLF